MKKIDLLHTTILIVAILCGYSALQSLLAVLNALIYMSDLFYDRSGATGAFVVPYLIQAVSFSIACIVLVKNGNRIAAYLLRNERQEYEEFLEDAESGDVDPGNAGPKSGYTETTTAEDPDAPEWHLDRRGILFALFIGIGLYTLIQYIPSLLNGLIIWYTDKVATGATELIRPRRDPLLLDLLRITIGAFLIYAAPTLTNYIERTISVRLQTGSKTR